MKNIDIIETILQIIHEDNLNFLAPKDSFIYESDSDSSTDSTLSTSSNLKYNWKAAEREERIKERVNEQYQANMYLLTGKVMLSVIIIEFWHPFMFSI